MIDFIFSIQRNQSHAQQILVRSSRDIRNHARPFGNPMNPYAGGRSNQNMFRYPYNIFPSNSYGVRGNDRHGNNRVSAAAQQDVGLLFEDLVPDNMWTSQDSGESCRISSSNVFPSAFYRWAEETAVLDGESVHDLVLVFQIPIMEHFLEELKEEVKKRTQEREERKKKIEEENKKAKEAGKKAKSKKSEAVEVQVNLTEPVVGGSVTDQSADEVAIDSAASGGAPTPAAHTPGNNTPGTPANTPNNTQLNTPTHTNTNTPTTSGPNTRPDSPVDDQAPTNHEDQLQAVSEELAVTELEEPDEISGGVATQTEGETLSYETLSETEAENDLTTSERMDTASTSATTTPDEQNDQMSTDSVGAPVEGTETQPTSATTDVTSTETPAPLETPEAAAPTPINPWGDIDPTFLIALPEEYRRDIYTGICNRMREQATTTNSVESIAPINSEFLEALPENIRTEVTQAHDRARGEIAQNQATQRAQAPPTSGTTAGTANPENDPVSFITEIPDEELRRQILADLDEESIARLPAELATQARSIQQDINQRHIRFLNSRNRAGRRHQTYTGRPNFMSTRNDLLRQRNQRRLMLKKIHPIIPKKTALDSESLACLLVIIFINDTNIQHAKLHRILKNVANHKGTRDWLTDTLIDIIGKTKDSSTVSATDAKLPDWLSLKLEASLGTRHCVFHTDTLTDSLQIHSQASTYICRATLDCLIYLSKNYPRHFVSAPDTPKDSLPKFWDLLMKLEKSKGTVYKKPETNDLMSIPFGESNPAENLAQLDQTILSKLLKMLRHPVIFDNRSLLDKMLHLLATISETLPELKDPNTDSIILAREIETAVKILTTNCCSEDGLEDCTHVLVALSKAHLSLRIQALKQLLQGARELGEQLKDQISELLRQLRTRKTLEKDDEKQPELQLPAMQMLTSKNSIQAFFLRILKVILQLRKNEVKMSSRRHSFLRWSENPRQGRGGGWMRFEQGSDRWRDSSRRYQFDETLNNAIHAAMSRSSPDAAETIIHVMEGMASSGASQANALLRARTRALQSRNNESQSEGSKSKNNSEKEDEAKKKKETRELNLTLAELIPLEELWKALSDSLSELDLTRDNHAFLVLQPAVEAFFMVHATQQGPEIEKKEQTKEEMFSHINDNAYQPPSPGASQEKDESKNNPIDPTLPENTKKFIEFAEAHRAVLNQILRQSSTPLSDGPFSVLTRHTKILDFDVKRRFFRQELDKIKERNGRGDTAIHVKRSQIFDDSFRELHRRTADEWKSRLYIVFDNEEGQDAGGLLREWFLVISRQMFNPGYALFSQAANDRVTYRINPLSDINQNDKLYFNFVGHVVAKAIYDNKLLECYFTRAFYKQIMGVKVTYKDMEAEDMELYKSLCFLLSHPVADLGYEINFSIDTEKFGETRTVDLKPNGRNIPVTDENKLEYVHLVCHQKLTGSVREQLRAFLEGFYEIIPKKLISIFDEQELELLISGLPVIDIDDLKANTEYHKYQPSSLQIQWFWRALRSFAQAERAKFLQFVTGTSKVPLQGFAYLEGMNGVQKFQIHRDERSTSRLPCAHTCFNQLDLPVYETYEKLRTQLLLAINESSEGFGLA